MFEKPTPIELPREWSKVVRGGVITAVGLARRATLEVVAGFVGGAPMALIAARIAGLEAEIVALKQELQIKDARFNRVPAMKRPHFRGTERFAILTLRAARGWTVAETARRFLVTPLTISHWHRRREESGDGALLRTFGPVNRFPEYVAEVAQALKATFPVFGTRKIAEVLARTGLHLADATVRRMLKQPAPRPPTKQPVDLPEDIGVKDETSERKAADGRCVSARHPHHVWHIDLTFQPTLFGLWVPWCWFTSPQWWPFGWWIGGVLDHKSRFLVATRIWKTQPSADDVVKMLDVARRVVRTAPKHIVSDRGAQFQSAYRAWCARHGVKARYGAVYQHGSIALIERFWRTLKEECLRRIAVPCELSAMRRELATYRHWYNVHRPHRALGGKTPLECLVPAGAEIASSQQLEPRASMPLRRGRDGPDAPLPQRVRHLALVVDKKLGGAELPIVHLRHAA